MSSTFTIYALAEPDSREIRYIGLTDNVIRRYRNHMSDHRLRRKGTGHVGNWKRKLKREGKTPGIVILEQYIPSREEAAMAEQFWIDYGKKQGWRLTNATNGGIGFDSDEQRRRWEAKSPEQKQQVIDMLWEVGNHNHPPSQAGRIVSLETREKLSKLNKGRKMSKEFCAARKAHTQGKDNPFYGHHHTEEARARIGRAFAKEYPSFINRDTGEVIPVGINLRKLCRDRTLSYSAMQKLLTGWQKSHKDWVVTQQSE